MVELISLCERSYGCCDLFRAEEMIRVAHYFLCEAPVGEDESAGYEFRLECDLTMSWRGRRTDRNLTTPLGEKESTMIAAVYSCLPEG